MWMGGNIPLGYDLDDHKLVINKAEAETVRLMFALYIQLKCVRKLKAEIEKRGLAPKSWVSESGRAVGGKPATAEILNVIASSPSDVQPVLDAIVRSFPVDSA